MKTLIALSAAALMSACATTQTTVTSYATKRPPARFAEANSNEPAPPAEGPEDVSPGAAQDPNRNPGLVPSPLLRYSAASMTP